MREEAGVVEEFSFGFGGGSVGLGAVEPAPFASVCNTPVALIDIMINTAAAPDTGPGATPPPPVATPRPGLQLERSTSAHSLPSSPSSAGRKGRKAGKRKGGKAKGAAAKGDKKG